MTTAPTTGLAEWKRFWSLPLAAAIGYSTAVLHTYAMGPFFAPIGEEFGWGRGQIAFGITIAGIAGAIFSVPMGVLVDRIGPRLVGLIGVVLMTSAFALLGTATGDDMNWILLWCFLAFANVWLQATIWTSAVATRFEASRGLAFAITFSGASIAAFIFPKLATTLIADHGWRNGFMYMGAIWAAVVLPIMLLFFRGARDGGAKQAAATQQAAARSDAPGLTVQEALRTPAFYQLLIASGLFTFTALGIIVHFVPILTDLGAEAAAAANVAALVGLFSIIGRLGTGFLLDRLPGKVVGAIAFLLPAVACLLLLYDGANPLNQAIAAAIFGLTVGAEVDVIAYLASRHFGLKNYGVLFGAVTGALALGVAFGPLAAGIAFDMHDGYGSFLMLTIVFVALSSAALATLGKARFGTDGAH